MKRIAIVIGVPITIGILFFLYYAIQTFNSQPPMYADQHNGLTDAQRSMLRSTDASYREKYRNSDYDNYNPEEILTQKAGTCLKISIICFIVFLVDLIFSKKDKHFDDYVEEMLSFPPLRLVIVAALFFVVGGIVYLFMEYLTATEEYPPKYDELWPFMGGFAILGVLVYYLIKLIIYIVKKIFYGKQKNELA